MYCQMPDCTIPTARLRDGVHVIWRASTFRVVPVPEHRACEVTVDIAILLETIAFQKTVE